MVSGRPLWARPLTMLFGGVKLMRDTACLCQVAAIDRERRADDESGSLGTQPDDHLGNFLRRPQAADWFLGDDLPRNLRVTLYPALDRRCPDLARAHRIDANSVRDILQRGGLGQSDDAMFRC
jgi:hypothetical protein